MKSTRPLFARAAVVVAVLAALLSSTVGTAQAETNQHDFVVRAKGQTGDERFEVRAGGELLTTESVKTEWSSYSMTLPEGTELEKVQVVFINDALQDSYDRNLYVDYVEFKGERFESEAITTISTGNWSEGSRCLLGNVQSEALHCNGYFQYAGSNPGEGAIKFVVQARGATGDERLEIRANGVVEATYSVTTEWASYPEVFAAETNLEDVQVAFVNDAVGPSYDRNLYVDYVEFDGKRFESESSSTLGTGTWRADSKCVAAKLQSEALHCNGYFQYAGANGTDPDPEPGQSGPFELNILHINDHHSHLQPSGGSLTLAGEDTDVELGGFPRVTAKINQLTAALGAESVVKIHAGDAITGTLFYTLFEGEADADLMNTVCFDVFALGNHEFDGSDAGLQKFLDFLAAGDCDTEVISANVIPEIGTPLAPDFAEQYIVPYTVRTIDGNQVAFIGINIKDKTQLSSSPLDTTEFLDEQKEAQATIDYLGDLGIDNIVLVTHVQYENDLELARSLTDVDAIVGGDSHSLLGDFTDVGLDSSGAYPTQLTNADGDPVCVVQAWQYSWVVGQLSLSFDGEGHVSECGGTPHLLLGDEFLREPADGEDEVPLEGEDLKLVLEAIEANPQLSIVTPDPAAEAVLEEYAEAVDVLSEAEVGTVTEDLCLERIPGQGRSSICDVSETAQQGGDIQQLVTEAFRQRAFEADIAIQNSGGVRIDIPAGPITIGDAYTLLPFANTLVYLDMTGEEIVALTNEAVSFATAEGGSTGAYPYAAGLRWDVDLTQTPGSQVSNFEVKSRDASEWTALDLSTTYRVVSNSFVAGGGDSYSTMEAVSDDGRATDTFLDYAQSFVDYIEQDLNGTVSKLPADEYSTKSFVPAE